MSSGPRTTVDGSMCRAGAAPRVRYMNGSGGATSPCHKGTFLGACSNCCHSLLTSLRTRRCMPLIKWLERRGGLFLDSASTLFFGGGRPSSEELPEHNSSSTGRSLSPGRMGSLPLFGLTGGAGWLPLRALSPRSSSKQVCKRSFSCCRRSARSHNSAICLACSSCFASIS